MHPSDCFRQLGLVPGASRRQIQRAYRRLALHLHPDKAPGDEAARRRFIQLTEAYRTLVGTAAAPDADESFAACDECGRFRTVYATPSGKHLCESCSLRPRGMLFLPMPPLVVVRCIASIVLIVASLGCLLAWVFQPEPGWLAAAAAGGILTFAMLAVTCVRVRVCTSPRDPRARHRATARRRRATAPTADA